MRTQSKLSSLAVLLSIFFLFAAAVNADVLITIEQKSEGTGDIQESVIYLSGDRYRGDINQTSYIFRGDLQKLWLINHQDETFAELTASDVNRLKMRLRDAKAEAHDFLHEEMESLSPEQRRQLEEAEASQEKLEEPEVTYRKIASKEDVGQWQCDLYERYENQEKQAELCVATMKSLNLKPEDFSALYAFLDFFDIGPSISDNDLLDLRKLAGEIGFEGFPIKEFRLADNGKLEETLTVTRIKRSSFPASLFELPVRSDHSGRDQ